MNIEAMLLLLEESLDSYTLQDFKDELKEQLAKASETR